MLLQVDRYVEEFPPWHIIPSPSEDRRIQRKVIDDPFAVLDEDLEDLEGLDATAAGGGRDAWGDLDNVDLSVGMVSSGMSKENLMYEKNLEPGLDEGEYCRLGDPPQSRWVKGNPRASDLVAAGKRLKIIIRRPIDRT